MNKWMIIPALAGAVAIGGVALASDSEVDAASKSEDILTLKEAKDLAIKKYGGKVTEIELEKTKSGYVYDVEVKSSGVEYDLDIDAITGKIKLEKQSTDKHVSKESSSESAQKANPAHNLKVVESATPRVAGTKLLTKDQAIAVAMKKAKGTVTKVELDSDDGRKHYDIEINDGTFEYDFEIDAITGKILEFEKDRDDDAKKVNKQATANQTNKVASTKKVMLTKDQAIAIAMKKAKGKVTEVELDSDDGRKHYYIDIKDGTYEYEFEIDAFTGKILDFEKDRDDDAKKVNKQATATKTNKVASTKKVMLTKDQAIAIAMKQANGTVTDFELDEDDGRKVYEIEIENGTYEYEFEIDAFTGKVLKFEKDREDD